MLHSRKQLTKAKSQVAISSEAEMLGLQMRGQTIQLFIGVSATG